jgi:hypothetical protein
VVVLSAVLLEEPPELNKLSFEVSLLHDSIIQRSLN